jgi:hypothetical protein
MLISCKLVPECVQKFDFRPCRQIPFKMCWCGRRSNTWHIWLGKWTTHSVKNEGPKPKNNNNASSLKSQIPKFPKLFLFSSSRSLISSDFYQGETISFGVAHLFIVLGVGFVVLGTIVWLRGELGLRRRLRCSSVSW